MPSTSPGSAPATTFAEVLPGTPAESLQATTTFVYRFKRYVAYISGRQLNVLSSPNTLVQALTFRHELIAVSADGQSGKLLVAGKKQAWILEPVAEGWTKLWWEKTLLLRHNNVEEDTLSICWSSDGEALVAGNISLTSFSTLPTSRSSSPRTSAVDGEAIEERAPVWSKPVARPVQQAACSPSSTLIATRSRYDRLVKIWRRLSFEEGLFDHTYLPHPAAVTHFSWRPLDEHAGLRRGSAISRRHDEEHEILYTVAADGILRIWRTGQMHELDVVVLHTSIDLVAAIPDSPSLSANGRIASARPPRYVVTLPSSQFSAALNAAIGLSLDNKISHAKELMKELVSKELDVIIVLDGQGRMSAWGVHSVGHKRRPDTPTAVLPFHIAHTEGLPLKLPANTPALPLAWFHDDKIHMLTHTLKAEGDVSWWQGTVESFFSTSVPGADRLGLVSSWRGIDIAAWSGRSDIATGASLSKSVSALQQSRVEMSSNGMLTTKLRSTESGVEKTIKTGTTTGALLAVNEYFAVVFRPEDNKLLIVDLREGFIEHEVTTRRKIRSVQCVTLKDSQNLVAIAHDTSVQILAQGRYESNNVVPNAWRHVQYIDLADIGLDITSVAWQPNGVLAIEAGTSLFIARPGVALDTLEDELRETLDYGEDDTALQIPELAAQLSRCLPVWHPTMLERLMLHGYARSVGVLMQKLAAKFKFWSPGDALDLALGEGIDDILTPAHSQASWISEHDVSDLKEQLKEKQLPAISSKDQERLAYVLDALLYLCDHVNGLDRNALWYLFKWKLQILVQEGSGHNEDGHINFVPEMSWREIAYAYHSASQQPLLDILILHYDNKLTWDIARSLGIMSWLTDQQALLQVFEQMARTAYRATQPPDPVNAAVYYLALHKKQTLLALWRIATWHREQRSTTNFLKKDFSQPDAKTAAKKNAYALMGKRRFHYAAAFFLLADDPADACNVLSGQCDDVQFAVAVARLYCGDGSTVLRRLLVDRIIPDAQKAGNRWLVSWCNSVLLDQREAAESLVAPLQGIVKTWPQDDPATMVLYKQLRKTSSTHEYSAVLRSAKILGRMGLSLLSMDLTKKWTFAQAVLSSSAEINGVTNGTHASTPEHPISEPEGPAAGLTEPPSLLDNFTKPEPVPSTAKDDQAAREAKAAELLAKIKARKTNATPDAEKKDEEKKVEKREPTQFKEPDANSLLNSFGF